MMSREQAACRASQRELFGGGSSGSSSSDCRITFDDNGQIASRHTIEPGSRAAAQRWQYDEENTPRPSTSRLQGHPSSSLSTVNPQREAGQEAVELKPMSLEKCTAASQAQLNKRLSQLTQDGIQHYPNVAL